MPPRLKSVFVSSVTLAALAVAPAANAAPPDTALEWFDATVENVTAAPAPTQVTNSRTWAIGWLAAARAVRNVPGGTDRAAYQDAALASAVHASLVSLIPTRKEQLDAALARTLRRVPDGPAETKGIAAGQRQAQAVLASREGDGLDPASVDAPFPQPGPAPGVWQPTPPSFTPGTQYGNRVARPFLLASPDQYRPGPPPALGSTRYRTDLAEVRAYGSLNSTVRTAHQTETAAFWYGSSFTLYTTPLRVALERARQPLAERTKFVALFHVALVDTQIATSDTKYAYVTWRPVTAIQSDDDGDPSTSPDPEWTPLHDTPAHPDYPSGHNTYSGAAEEVLTAFVGPRTAPFTLDSPSLPDVTRTYTDWRTLSLENVDARVWSGIHTRTADTVGITLGHRVAVHALRNADRLFH